jgi:hypothetical protein
MMRRARRLSPLTVALRERLMSGPVPAHELQAIVRAHGVTSSYGAAHFARILPAGYKLSFDTRLVRRYRVYSVVRQESDDVAV